jgi:hypothetical protein
MASIGANSPFPEIWKTAEDMADRQFRLEQAELAQRNADRAFELRNNAVMPTAVPASRRAAVPKYNLVQPAATAPAAARTFGTKGVSIAPAAMNFGSNTPSNMAYAAMNSGQADPRLFKRLRTIGKNIKIPNTIDSSTMISQEGIDFLVANGWTQERLDNTPPEDKAAAIRDLWRGQIQKERDERKAHEAFDKREGKANALLAKAEEANESARQHMIPPGEDVGTFARINLKKYDDLRRAASKQGGLSSPDVEKYGKYIRSLDDIRVLNDDINRTAANINGLENKENKSPDEQEYLEFLKEDYKTKTLQLKDLTAAWNRNFEDEIQERNRRTEEEINSLYGQEVPAADPREVADQYQKRLNNQNYYAVDLTTSPDETSREFKRRQKLQDAVKAGDFRRAFALLTPKERKKYFPNYDPANQTAYNQYRQQQRIQQAKLNNAELQLQSDNEKLRSEKELRKFNMRQNDPAADAIGLVHAGVRYEQLPEQYKEALIQHENDVFGGSYLSDPTFEDQTGLIRETYKKNESLAPGYNQFARRIFSAENGVKVDKNGNIVPVYSNSGSSGKGRTFTVKSNLSDEELTQRTDEYLTGNPEVKLSEAGKKMVIELMRSDRSLTPETAINKLRGIYIADRKGNERLWDNIQDEIKKVKADRGLGDVTDDEIRSVANEYRQKAIEQDNVDYKKLIRNKFKIYDYGKAPKDVSQENWYFLNERFGRAFSELPDEQKKSIANVNVSSIKSKGSAALDRIAQVREKYDELDKAKTDEERKKIQSQIEEEELAALEALRTADKEWSELAEMKKAGLHFSPWSIQLYKAEKELLKKRKNRIFGTQTIELSKYFPDDNKKKRKYGALTPVDRENLRSVAYGSMSVKELIDHYNYELYGTGLRQKATRILLEAPSKKVSPLRQAVIREKIIPLAEELAKIEEDISNRDAWSSEINSYISHGKQKEGK